jgi:hypothetical protein
MLAGRLGKRGGLCLRRCRGLPATQSSPSDTMGKRGSTIGAGDRELPNRGITHQCAWMGGVDWGKDGLKRSDAGTTTTLGGLILELLERRVQE